MRLGRPDQRAVLHALADECRDVAAALAATAACRPLAHAEAYGGAAAREAADRFAAAYQQATGLLSRSVEAHDPVLRSLAEDSRR